MNFSQDGTKTAGQASKRLHTNDNSEKQDELIDLTASKQGPKDKHEEEKKSKVSSDQKKASGDGV